MVKEIFFGIKSKQIHDIAKKYYGIGLPKIKELLKSKIHEQRVCALRILDKNSKSQMKKKKKIFFKKQSFYNQSI